MNERYWDQDIETLSVAKLDELKLEKFKRLIEVAYEHSAFYRAAFIKAGLSPSEFNRLEDIEKIPLSYPHDLLSNPEDFQTNNSKIILVTCSGGTYRKPKKIYRTSQDILYSVEATARMFYTCGVRSSDSFAILQSFGIWGIALLALEACEKIGCKSLPIGVHMDDEEVLELLKEEKVTVIYAVPSNAVRLTEHAIRKYDLQKDFSVRRILVAGEKLSKTQKENLESLWGARVFNIYGSEETDGLGVECEEHSGIHFCYDQFVAEVLDPLTNRRKSLGEAGILAITPLNHFGTILIRYVLGDVVRFIPSRCACGRTAPFIEILGREEESLTLMNGTKLVRYQIEQFLLNYFEKIPSFQVMHQRHTDRDHLDFLIVERDKDDKIGERLGEDIRNMSLDLYSAIQQGLVEVHVKLVDLNALTRTERGKVPAFVEKGGLENG